MELVVKLGCSRRKKAGEFGVADCMQKEDTLDTLGNQLVAQLVHLFQWLWPAVQAALFLRESHQVAWRKATWRRRTRIGICTLVALSRRLLTRMNPSEATWHPLPPKRQLKSPLLTGLVQSLIFYFCLNDKRLCHNFNCIKLCCVKTSSGFFGVGSKSYVWFFCYGKLVSPNLGQFRYS